MNDRGRDLYIMDGKQTGKFFSVQPMNLDMIFSLDLMLIQS